MQKIILASASERRSMILNACGIEHIVEVSDAPEIGGEAWDIKKIVSTNAENKAKKVAFKNEGRIVIGADTLVCCRNELIGKPKNKAEAEKILKDFSGASVDVFTGHAVFNGLSGKMVSGAQKSSVFTEQLTEKDFIRYLPLLAPHDKAGGFSIEGVGAFIFDDIKGSYFNILGLSPRMLKKLFHEAGLDIVDFIKG